jgi:hypothetical protein
MLLEDVYDSVTVFPSTLDVASVASATGAKIKFFSDDAGAVAPAGITVSSILPTVVLTGAVNAAASVVAVLEAGVAVASVAGVAAVASAAGVAGMAFASGVAVLEPVGVALASGVAVVAGVVLASVVAAVLGSVGVAALESAGAAVLESSVRVLSHLHQPVSIRSCSSRSRLCLPQAWLFRPVRCSLWRWSCWPRCWNQPPVTCSSLIPSRLHSC